MTGPCIDIPASYAVSADPARQSRPAARRKRSWPTRVDWLRSMTVISAEALRSQETH
jgi:hypothetical protein